MRKIIYTRPDGGLSVVIPVRNTHPNEDNLTDDEIEQRAWKKLPADAIAPEFVDGSAIPADRTFRNAWKAAPGRVEHDIPKCKELAHNMRREKRAAELAPLDEIIAKQIPGNNPQQVEAQRRVIRDKYAAVQSAIDAAQDVAAIKAALGL